MATPAPWWQRRWCVAAALLLAALPMLWPSVAPLTDLPGHIGRYRILAEAGTGPLARHFAVHWGLIGNLGVDLLVLALHPVLDVEPATRLIVTLIPVVTVVAMLWVAREAHGHVPASAGFALPLAYAYPFQLGFVNFCLSAALAIAGLALWLRLARVAPPVVRLALFAPLACLVWLCHSFGWAMLGLFVFGAEWWLRIEAKRGWWRGGIEAAVMCLPMALPVVAMIGGGDRMVGDTGDWFNLTAKAQWAISLLRERWEPLDLAAIAILAFVGWTAIRSTRFGFAPLLGMPALLGLVAFALLPRLYLGGAYVDMRVLPYAVALGLLAIRVAPGEQRIEHRLAALGAGFFVARIATTTLAFILYAQQQGAVLRALRALTPGSAVLVLVDEPGRGAWTNPRLAHIAGLAVARRRVFVNEQWAIPGQQTIAPRHAAAAPLDRDPSQLVYPASEAYRTTDVDAAIAGFDRCTFDAVWTIGFPAGRARAADLSAIWSDGHSAVYRVGDRPCRK